MNKNKYGYGDSCFFFNPPGLEVRKIHKDIDLSFGFLSLYLTLPPLLKTMRDIEKEVNMVMEEVVKLKGVRLLKRGGELKKILEERDIAIILLLQGLPEDANVKRMREIGIRVVPLMYGSNSGKGNKNFRCEKFVRECVEEGIKIDLSHCSHTVARGAVRVVQKTGVKGALIASHTGCFEVYDISRNLPDDVLKDIIDMDGIIGISSITFHLSEQDNTIRPLLNHLYHIISLGGENNVAIGSDRPYMKMEKGWWEKRTQWMQEKLDPEKKMGIRFPDQPYILNTPAKMSVIQSELLSNGYNMELAKKITGENLHRFITTYM